MSSELVRFALLILAASVAVGPILLHRDFRFRTRIDAVPVPLGDLPVHARGYMLPRVVELASLGFELVGYFDVTGTSVGTASYLALAVNCKTNEWANVSYVTTVPAGVERGFIEFIAASSGGRVETNTNGAPTPLFPAAHPIFRFPQVEEAATLYRLHRRFVEEKLGDAVLQLPARGEETGELTRRLQSYAQHQERRGNMRRDADGEYARLTWKGAIVISWRGLWPVALRRRLRMYREAEQRLEALEAVRPSIT